MSSKKRGDISSRQPTPAKRIKENISSPLSWTDAGVQALLPGGEAVVFVGNGILTVLSGEIDIGGYIASAGEQPLNLCADEQFPVLILAESAEARPPLIGSGGAVFSIERCSRQGSSIPSDEMGFSVFLPGDPQAPPFSTSIVPNAWKESAEQIVGSIDAGRRMVGTPPPAVIAICGAKKVGKSTFARYLTNRLLNIHPVVAYLDTDCGQPEFTPPGIVSMCLLTSPVVSAPHMHQRPPDKAFFQGDMSPAADAQRYVQSIRSLFTWLAGEVENSRSAGLDGSMMPPPIIVNSHGWIKGFGYDVLVDVLRALPVTHFVNITAANPRRNLPQGAFWDPSIDEAPTPLLLDVPGVHHASSVPGALPPQANSPSAGNGGGGGAAAGPSSHPAAVEQRALHWMAFAEACVQASSSGQGLQQEAEYNDDAQRQEANNACAVDERHTCALGGEENGLVAVGDRLAAANPFEVSLRDLRINILHSDVPRTEMERVLNGAIVGLCSLSERKKERSVDDDIADGLLPCLGLGLVRAVDANAGMAYVLSPLTEDRLQMVDALEVGRLELPPALLQTKKYLSPYLALHSLASSGTGAGAIKSRNNLLRAGQVN